MPSILLAALAATLGATAPASPAPASPAPRPAPDLSVRPSAIAPPASAVRRATPGDASPPACSGDLCQPAVAVPGFEPRWERPSRTLLAATYLERAHLEPFATLAWILVATGLQLDWQPPAFAGPSQTPTRWGKVSVRVRLRLDPDNHPVVLERSESGDGQRPARRKST